MMSGATVLGGVAAGVVDAFWLVGGATDGVVTVLLLEGLALGNSSAVSAGGSSVEGGKILSVGTLEGPAPRGSL